MHVRKTLVIAFLALVSAAPSWAATHYVASGEMTVSGTPDGSKAKPWTKISQAISKAQSGDTILLMDGRHPALMLNDVAFDAPVVIRSENSKRAKLSSIKISGASRNLILRNLSVWPSNPSNVETRRLIDVTSSSVDLIFDGLDVRSAEDVADYPTWSSGRWSARGFGGFYATGKRITIQNSTFTGIGTGIQILGDDSNILNNSISGFAYDGMRALGNRNVVRGNKLTDCVRIDGNHPDGLQSWSRNGKPVDGLVVEKNVIIEWSNAIESPYRCRLQGIGLFDGFYDNLVIRNNVVSVTAYHGISVYGGRDVLIANNTVVNGKGEAKSYPWIGIFSHKNRTPSSDVISSNNLAMKFANTSATVNRTASRNVIVVSPAKVFMDVAKFDYRPKTDSGFIDSGNSTFAPPTDVRNHRRPAGAGPDRGAYEMNSTAIAATDEITPQAIITPTENGDSSSTSTAGKWLSAP